MARVFAAGMIAALAMILGVAPSRAQNAYITNCGSDSVSVIATATNTVVGSPIAVGTCPYGVTVTPDGTQVYVANSNSNNVSAIATATSTVTATIPVGTSPIGVAVTPNGSFAYVANYGSATVSVIATATNAVVGSPITVGSDPVGVVVTPDGNFVYVANDASATVSVIATATNTVTTTIRVGSNPLGVAIAPDGSTVYVASYGTDSVYVIATASNTVTTTIPVGSLSTGVAVTPDGSTLYVTNEGGTTVSVIATATNTVVGSPITVGSNPYGVSVTPDGSQAYVANLNSNTVSVIATASNTVTATIPVGVNPFGFGAFMSPAATLTVAENGSGTGQVTSSPAGIDCGNGNNACAVPFALGTIVTLTAIPAAGSVFAGWSGGCSGTASCVVTLNAAVSVTATFTQTYGLTVLEGGTGTGQVTSRPSGIDCSATSNTCSASFNSGTSVTLTASAAAGSSFAGWSGGGCVGTGTCQVTLNGDTTVTATFAVIPSYMLSVVPSGNGSGTVTSSPSGINCGATCNASFTSGTQVTLTAAAGSNSTFAGWSGGGCGGTASCVVTMSVAVSVTATFVQNSATNIVLAAAVLPASRSVEVGATATAFATIVNAGPGDATACGIAPQTSVPASFLYQTTDPTTNALNGSVNIPANIAQGASQSFLIALTPTAAFAPTDIAFNFACANASTAAVLSGVNTLELSASTTPVPDIVALAASSDPGYVDIPSATGMGAFAVATVNLGSTAPITVVANTGMSLLPVTLQVCQSDPTSGTCLQPPSSAITTTIAANATPTFNVFVASIAALTASPGTNRVFVTFTDAGGVLRGETSVAVRTQ